MRLPCPRVRSGQSWDQSHVRPASARGFPLLQLPPSQLLKRKQIPSWVLSNEPREPAPNSSFPHHAAKSGVKHRQHSKSGSLCLFSFWWLGFALRLYSIWGSSRTSRCHEALPGFPSKSGVCLLGRGPSMAGPLLHPISCCPVSCPG